MVTLDARVLVVFLLLPVLFFFVLGYYYPGYLALAALAWYINSDEKKTVEPIVKTVKNSLLRFLLLVTLTSTLIIFSGYRPKSEFITRPITIEIAATQKIMLKSVTEAMGKEVIESYLVVLLISVLFITTVVLNKGEEKE